MEAGKQSRGLGGFRWGIDFICLTEIYISARTCGDNPAARLDRRNSKFSELIGKSPEFDSSNTNSVYNRRYCLRSIFKRFGYLPSLYLHIETYTAVTSTERRPQWPRLWWSRSPALLQKILRKSPRLLDSSVLVEKQKHVLSSGISWLIVTGSAGIAELAIFHPVDTIAKRLMSNQGKVASAARLNEVIFRDTAHAPVFKKFTSLFPGLGYAAGYKVPPILD